MMQIHAEIRTVHRMPGVAAGAVTPDNLKGMETTADGGVVRTVLAGPQLRSTIASVDDYLMNLAVVEDLCTHVFT
ncbi:MAG: hypothetical protein LUO87_00815 [Methanomicrobiales archaeon]|nr:hypothetical protein [Methanomicrobiales archaeon]MDD1659828.1 hypothetical protein [Methanomicrobiales archaeon]